MRTARDLSTDGKRLCIRTATETWRRVGTLPGIPLCGQQVYGERFRVQAVSLRIRVNGKRFRVEGSGLRVEDLGFRV